MRSAGHRRIRPPLSAPRRRAARRETRIRPPHGRGPHRAREGSVQRQDSNKTAHHPGARHCARVQPARAEAPQRRIQPVLPRPPSGGRRAGRIFRSFAVLLPVSKYRLQIDKLKIEGEYAVLQEKNKRGQVAFLQLRADDFPVTRQPVPPTSFPTSDIGTSPRRMAVAPRPLCPARVQRLVNGGLVLPQSQ